MTDQPSAAAQEPDAEAGHGAAGSDQSDPTAPGSARSAGSDSPSHGRQGHGGEASVEPGGYDEYDHEPLAAVPDDASELVGTSAEVSDAILAAERLADLQRLQAEYVNYKKRVDRDRDVARDLGISQVLEALLPVLDDIHLAREHGDLEGGPFASIADKLEHTLAKFGVERFGQVHDPFDPAVHEALMHVEADLPDHAESTTVVQVLQPGFKIGERVIRPARVSVADPE